jgi:hypothetical protein
MDAQGQQQGNNVVALPRRAGRPRGSRNRVTREIRELAQRYTRRALRAAWKLSQEAGEEEVRLRALGLILSYGHGKPTQATEISAKIESKPVTAGEAGQTVADAALAVALARKTMP